VVYNLPGTSRGLPEGVPQQAQVAGGGMQGRNDFGKTGYGGPCPPPGKAHRYFFRVYALKSSLKLPAEASADDVQRAMTGQVLATAELMGRFGR
jgi:Raf kinase inhibitor-like YbhB/YbcL family protein